jgi:choline dehydrogenase-like flavoprotein
VAINLKPVDVAVIGLGAAGGVAVLPLARAGLKVAGIEAGGWTPTRLSMPTKYLTMSVAA